MEIGTIIKKIKPAISSFAFISGMLVFSLLEENITLAWEGIGIALLSIGIIAFFSWTLGTESESINFSD